MNKRKAKTILIIDGDKNIQKALTEGLSEKGFTCCCCDSAQEGIDFCIKDIIDLVILELNLKDRDGMSVIDFLRTFNNKISIIVLSKRNSVSDKVLALEAGANDYVTKPFSFLELVARINKEFRYKFEDDEHIISNGPLQIDYEAKSVFVNGKEVHLTNFEYKILLLLAQNLGKTVDYEEIIGSVWGDGTQDQNGLRVFVAGIRKKIEKDANSKELIKTCVGMGYRMDVYKSDN